MQNAAPAPSSAGLRTSEMLSRMVRSVAATLILALSSNVALAVKPRSDAASVKASIEKRGIGNSTKIIRTDGSTVLGKIDSISVDSFRMTPRRSNAPVEIAFVDVSSVHGPGLSGGTKVGLGVLAGVIGAVIVVVILVKSGHGHNVGIGI